MVWAMVWAIETALWAAVLAEDPRQTRQAQAIPLKGETMDPRRG